MGDVLRWTWPIEWDDGTACELDPTEARRVFEGEAMTAYFVRSTHEPRGWNRKTMPKLGLTRPFMVQPDGTLDCARGPGAPRIVNTQMPMIRMPDGSEPVRAQIVQDGTRLILWSVDGKEHVYTWPRLQALGGSKKLTVLTPAMLEAEEKAHEEERQMLDNPLFGMF